MQGFLIYEQAELSRNGWFVQKCMDFATRHGLNLELKLADRFSLGIQNNAPALWYEGQSVSAPQFAIVRSHDYRLTEQLEALGTRCFNNGQVARICNNKALTHAYLAGKGIPMVDTFYYTRHFALPNAPFLPAVVKAAGGHGGTQVFWAETQAEYQSICQELRPFGDVVVQRPAKTLGKDMRVYVLGNQILAAVLRTGKDDFRSNFSLGGRVEAVTLTQDQIALVQRVLEHFSFDYAGLDFIFDGEQMLLNEIEDVVGSRMLYQTTELDAVELYLQYVLKNI